jgi:CheY-like chemotaxis protein
MSVSILVVDDEPDVAELFRQRFRRETRQGKYVLHYATSGADALDRLAGEIEPTLVAGLSDINMPGMDGLQLLGEIKQRFPDLPVVMGARLDRALVQHCGHELPGDVTPDQALAILGEHGSVPHLRSNRRMATITVCKSCYSVG